MKSRIEKEFIPNKNWLAEAQRLVRDIQPQLPNPIDPATYQPIHGKSPNPLLQAIRELQMTKTEVPAESAPITRSSPARSEDHAKARRQMIDRFIDRVLKDSGIKISRAAINRVAGRAKVRNHARQQFR